ncbi:MAG: FtsX-like permease family protein, partial [Candidatus Magasanikbacteria bacterium]|nr:FtsX-like permease family protein [Candidatus Magasanikbacteria bacterium]
EFNALIENKTFDDHGPVIQKIGLITSKTQQVGIILGLILTIVAFLIIFNVIRLSIIMHGEEIGIMKLVGATNSFVRWPFLVEMFFVSLLAWGINLGLIYGVIYFVDPYLFKFFEGSGFSLRNYFDQNFLIFFGAELVGLIVLSFVSASLAMRKYLKV